MEKFLDIQILIDCKTETSFPIRSMSSTYNTRNTTTLLFFLYIQGSSRFCEKPNSLIVSSNWTITLSHKLRFIGNHITFHACLLFEDPLTPYGFYPFEWINQRPYWFVYMESISDFMVMSHLLNSKLLRDSS